MYEVLQFGWWQWSVNRVAAVRLKGTYPNVTPPHALQLDIVLRVGWLENPQHESGVG